MLKNMKVGLRLGVSFAVVIGLIAALSILSIARLQGLNDSVHLLVGDRFEKVLQVNDAINHVNIIARALRNMLLWNDPAEVKKESERIAVSRAATTEILDLLDKAITTTEGRKLLDVLQKARAAYIQGQDQVMAHTNGGRRDEATSQLLGSFRAQQSEYIAAWEALRDYQVSLAKAAGAEAESDTDLSLRIIIAIGFAAAIIAVLLALLITRSIVRPLAQCIGAAEKISAGDLTVELNADGKDELAALQRAMITMRETLQRLVAETSRISDAAAAGRLTERAAADRFSGSYRELVSGVNDIIEGLVGFIDNMPTPAMIIDANFQVLFMNKAGASLGATTGRELVETRRRCYDYFKTGDCKTERCACSQAMRIGGDANSQTLAKPLDKSYDIAYTGVPVRDRSGKIIGAFEVVVDQTAIKQAERQMVKIADFQNGEIAKLNDYMERVAQGDMSGEFSVAEADSDTRETKERLDSLAAALNAMVDSINDILGQVSSAVDQVTAGSQQVSQASQSLSQGATEQASSLEEITSSVTEIAGQTRQNTENAVQVNGLSRTAKEDAERGNAQMQDLVSAMSDINASAEEIRKIVKAIDDISFQINLLALNANVEAARAGKYGKGFAVVAEEVRNLAVRSAGSVKETTAMVDGTIANIGKGNALVEVTAKQLASIVEGSAKVAGLAEEVATASREQSQGLEQISTGLNQIDQVTQANTASAEESASAAEELSSQAQQLKAMVGRFKLKERENRMSNADMIAMLRAELASQGGGKSRALTLHREDAKAGKSGPAAPSARGGKTFVNPADLISLDDDDFGKF
jgi:methyl-accepting chemotaxis protein